jgi:DNA repair protein RecO (recombination protein O)
MAMGSIAVEAVTLGVEEEEASPELFCLLAEGLDLLEESPRPGLVMQGFLLHLLRLLGYLPELSACVSCRTGAPPRGEAYLSPSQGGLLCPGCQPGALDAIPTSSAALGFLRGASCSTLRVIDRVSTLPQVLQEVSSILQAFLRHILGRSLRSADFLASL